MSYLSAAQVTVPTPPDEFGPGFLADIGTWGTSADGMDAIIALMFTTITADASLTTGIGTIINGLGFTAGAMEKAIIDPLVSEQASYGPSLKAPFDALYGNGMNWSPWPLANVPKGPVTPPAPKCPPGYVWKYVGGNKPPVCVKGPT